MKKFKVGDKVIAKANAPYNLTTKGWRGTVVGTLENPNGHLITLNDDIAVRQYNCSRGSFSVKSKYFDVDPSNQKIVITTDGKTTTAKLYDGKSVVKTATAKCSPDDVFDFNVGTLLSIGRLVKADCELSENDSFDWKSFKNDEFFVEVTEGNFDNFVEEAKKHGCYFKAAAINPFKDHRMSFVLTFERFTREAKGVLCAPNDTVYIGCKDNSLKLTVANPGKKMVFVW